MIDLVIFDFDGLILDTETPDYESWHEIFLEYGVDLPMAAWNDAIGTLAGVFDPVSYLEERLGRTLDREGLESRRTKRFHGMLGEQPLLPGVEQYLDEADTLGVRTAVASSATRVWVEGHLRRFGIFDRFACVRTIEDVGGRAKPDPALFLEALNATGVSADRAVVLEDSPNGVLAANRAGIFCVAIPNPMTAMLGLDHANLRLGSLVECSLSELSETVERHHGRAGQKTGAT